MDSRRAQPLPNGGRRDVQALRAATSSAHSLDVRSASQRFSRVCRRRADRKSRLAAELAAIVAVQGGGTLIGLTSSPQRVPYQARVDGICGGLPYLAHAALDPLWLSVIASRVRGVRTGLPPLKPLDPRAAHARLHEGFARVFETIAQTRPLLLATGNRDCRQQASCSQVADRILEKRYSALDIRLSSSSFAETGGIEHSRSCTL